MFKCSSDFDRVKTYVKIDAQLPTVLHNIFAIVDKTPLSTCDRNSTLAGQVTGPIVVSLGNDAADSFAVGPELPGAYGLLCWVCCFFGGPCAVPYGFESAKAKSLYNSNVTPKIGFGISR